MLTHVIFAVANSLCVLHNLAENWSWARDINGRDRDETEKSASQDRDIDNFCRDETETEASRPRPQAWLW